MLAERLLEAAGLGGRDCECPLQRADAGVESGSDNGGVIGIAIGVGARIAVLILNLTTGCWAKGTPAVAVAEGGVWSTRPPLLPPFRQETETSIGGHAGHRRGAGFRNDARGQRRACGWPDADVLPGSVFGVGTFARAGAVTVK